MAVGQRLAPIAEGTMKKAAVALIINDKGLILSVSRRHDTTKFGLPGGKVEENEESWQAAVRETREETGIAVEQCEHIFTRMEPRHAPEGTDFMTDCFYASAWHGEPQDSEEGVVKWLTVKELTETNGAFPEYNTLTIEAFRTKFPNVFLKEE